MIIPAEKANKASNVIGHADEHRAEPPLDPPPSYSPPRRAACSGQTAVPVVRPAAMPKACNYLSLSRPNNAIRESYTVDPNMYIPRSLLSPLGRGESESDRKNLKLESSNGAIDVEIFLLGQTPGGGAKSSRRTTMNVKTLNGSINIRLNTPATSRDPFHLTAFTVNGSMTIRLPRSFHGLLISTASSINMSDALAEHVTTFSEINSTKRCFVGDLSEWSEGEEGWFGDEVSLATKNGRVKIMYTDEVPTPPSKGFFSRVMGL